MKYSELPLPYKDRARRNAIRYKAPINNTDEHIIKHNYDSIDHSFEWDETIEGWDFWRDVNHAETEGELPDIETKPSSLKGIA